MVQAELANISSNKAEYEASLKQLCELVHQIAEQHQLDIQLPTRAVKVQRSRPLRTLKWQKRSNVVMYAHQAWLEDLASPNKILEGDDLYIAWLCSALFHSGLATPEELFAFINVPD